jgi:phenol hydroxylase P1 protein
MEDWYAFKDPRHFYYGVYVMARAKQQDATEKQYEFVEKRQLLGQLDAATRQRIQSALVPLRHYEWGANMNNCTITAYGWGAAITQATMFATMDRLGNAQYLTRVGLMLDANGDAALAQAKEDWLHAPAWQGVRRLVENLFVTKDWFEVFVAQNLVFDGLLYPLVYRHLEADLNPATGNALSMLTSFMNDWYDEAARWVDATVKTAAEESPANAQQLSAWAATWRGEILRALAPLATAALGAEDGAAALAQADAALVARMAKLGIAA